MSTAVLSIGSNLGDRLATLQAAVDAVRPWLRAVSPVYETPPWGPVPQGDYLNAVLLVSDDDADARMWLRRSHATEQAAGRARDVRWGPRTLDVDIVIVEDVTSGSVESVTSDDPELTLPHPRASERAFVLVPWAAADPSARLAGRAITDLLAALPRADVEAVRLVQDAGLR
ncbi:MAG: 2-amino-4-hydroxy-6-hydroxymethyldihydropteridine diphosphokinase [Jatrophihabitans sp.]